jgi:hypothetical protein
VTRGPFRFPSATARRSTSQTFNISEIGALPEGSFVFYRVGARASTDAKPPINLTSPNGGDYIYSGELVQFQTTEAPPNPPSP